MAIYGFTCFAFLRLGESFNGSFYDVCSIFVHR